MCQGYGAIILRIVFILASENVRAGYRHKVFFRHRRPPTMEPLSLISCPPTRILLVSNIFRPHTSFFATMSAKIATCLWLSAYSHTRGGGELKVGRLRWRCHWAGRQTDKKLTSYKRFPFHCLYGRARYCLVSDKGSLLTVSSQS